MPQLYHIWYRQDKTAAAKLQQCHLMVEKKNDLGNIYFCSWE
jgi:hypothetical protein